VIDLLIRLLYSENIDKQLIRRLLYNTTCSLPFILVLSYFNLLGVIYTNIMLFLIPSFSFFILSNTYFNYVITKSVKESLGYVDFQEFVSKFSDIWDNKTSFYSDLQQLGEGKKIRELSLLAVATGFSLFIFIFSILSIMFRYVELGWEIWIAITFVLLFLIYYDILKLDLIQKDTENINAYTGFVGNLLEKYIVTNSLEQTPYPNALMYITYFLVNLLSPIIKIRAPNWYIDVGIYYREPTLVNTLSDLVEKKEDGQEEEKRGIILREIKEKSVFPIEKLLKMKAATHVSKILNKTPKDLWPYLFDPKYKPERETKKGKSKDFQRKYTILQIVSKTKKKEIVVGYLFVNLFKSVDIDGYEVRSGRISGREKGKVYLRKDGLITWYKPTMILYIIFVGEENYIRVLKTRFDINGRVVPEKLFPINV